MCASFRKGCEILFGDNLRRKMESPICQDLEQLLYTTSRPDETSHNCVIVIDKHSAFTFHHGPHENLTENQVVTIYNTLDSNIQFECVVGKESIYYDLVCLKLIEGEFPVVPKLGGSISNGQEYIMVGLDAEKCPIWRDGVISESNSEEVLTYYTGTTEGDFPGAGIFDEFGRLLGIVVGIDLAESGDNRIRMIGYEVYPASPTYSAVSPVYSGTPASPTYSKLSPSGRGYSGSPTYSPTSPSYTGTSASPPWSYT
ncbi:unnamed protein product [Caenorhabditis angaria]|uniref:Uncharacterized protein n=1 Tax=Caenorhabditis angaria TaxID=860376 RepID=A0A9P1IQG9_9PELO|nr:unnamed protein product [Caenorhabditis angaria]